MDSHYHQDQGCLLSEADLMRVFREMDANGNGTISKVEMLAALRGQEFQGRDIVHLLHLPEQARGWGGMNQLFNEVFADIDADGSDSIDANEFIHFFMRRQQQFHSHGNSGLAHSQLHSQAHSQQLSRGAPQFNSAGSRGVAPAAAGSSSSAKYAGAPVTAQDLCRIFHSLDANNDGKVSRTELLAGLRGLELDGRDVLHVLALPEALRSWGGASDLFHEVFSEIDQDRSNTIEESEFVNFFLKKISPGALYNPVPHSHAHPPQQPQQMQSRGIADSRNGQFASSSHQQERYSEQTRYSHSVTRQVEIEQVSRGQRHAHNHQQAPQQYHGPPITERDLSAIFDQLDANRQGVITRPEMLAGVRNMDYRGHDLIDVLQLPESVRAWGGVGVENFNRLFADIDANRNQLIEKSEFIAYFSRPAY